VINADLSSNGYKESFGIMVDYYYELEKIFKNHEDFVNKGKISIMSNLREHV
jgi:malonyl-CoA decarboxylase